MEKSIIICFIAVLVMGVSGMARAAYVFPLNEPCRMYCYAKCQQSNGVEDIDYESNYLDPVKVEADAVKPDTDGFTLSLSPKTGRGFKV